MKEKLGVRRGAAALSALLTLIGLVAYFGVGIASADEPQFYKRSDPNVTSVDREVLRKATATPRDGAYFWTGRVNGTSVEGTAADVAKRAGGKTLELALDEAGVTMPVFDDRTPEALEAWKDASLFFAEQASGVTHVVMGQQLRDGNVFETLERPALEANPNVTKIVKIDAVTFQEEDLFVRDPALPGGGDDKEELKKRFEEGSNFEIRQEGTNDCLNIPNGQFNDGVLLGMANCAKNVDQAWVSIDGKFRSRGAGDGNLCLGGTARPQLVPCDGAPEFFRSETNESAVVKGDTNTCLFTIDTISGGIKEVFFRECDGGAQQRWTVQAQ
jgi:hypothetical protein